MTYLYMMLIVDNIVVHYSFVRFRQESSRGWLETTTGYCPTTSPVLGTLPLYSHYQVMVVMVVMELMMVMMVMMLMMMKVIMMRLKVSPVPAKSRCTRGCLCIFLLSLSENQIFTIKYYILIYLHFCLNF